MSNKHISLTVALVGVTALGLAVACSSSGNGNGASGSGGNSGSSSGSSTSGSGTSGSGTSGSGSASGSGASSGSAASGSGSTSSVLTIDDQSNTGGQISRIPPASSGDKPGTWFSYVANGAPLTQVMPAQGSSPFPFQSISPAATTSGPKISEAACLSSTGFQGYSVGEGFHFQASLPAGAADAGIAATPVTFDASSYSGISFWAMATGSTPPSLRVKIPDDQTDGDPFANSACKGDSGSNSACFDDFSLDLPPLTATWTQVTVPFGTTGQHSFGTQFTALDTKNIYGVEFEVEGLGAFGADAGFAPSFDFCIAQVAFTQ